MKRRSLLRERSVATALLLSLMLLHFHVFTPKVEATYTYPPTDPTYPQIDWMDVASIAWDFNPKELLLKVQCQTNIPNNPNHWYYGDFYLDTDQNPATGSAGFDYRAYFVILGDGSDYYCELHRWDAASTNWVFVKDLGKPLFQAGGDTVELGIPLADIGSPTAINIYYQGENNVCDYIQAKYTYNIASRDRSITVDGNPADWASDLPDVTDPSGDATPGWADAIKFYTTTSSTAKKLYMRMDLAATPLSLHPEENGLNPQENGYLEQLLYIYFDIDRNLGTGKSIGGIGAEYRLVVGVRTTHTSRTAGSSLYGWSGTGWTFVPSATPETAVGTCFEWSVLLSNIGVTGLSIIDTYIEELLTTNWDRVPNSGTFTARATIEIAYDTGTAAANSNIDFAGVRFSLPDGVSSARLLAIRYQLLGIGSLTVHITRSDHVTELTGSPVATSNIFSMGTWNVLDVSGLGIAVSEDFFVVLQRTSQRFVLDSLPTGGVGRSFAGPSLAGLISSYGSGCNLLIRAVIGPMVSRVLSEASTQILSASASSVYFIYADPNRMVSATGPWNAAFAAYDATAAGFIYGLCANSQVICYDSDGTIVVAKAPPSDPPFNYGKVLPSSKRIVVVGGPTPNWVVDYYERTGQTPLKFYRGTTDYGFQTQAGTVAYTIPKTTDFAHNDLFVVMAFQDSNNNYVLVIYGMNWKGTFAGGIYFKEVIKPNLATYTKSAYVFRWIDAGAMDAVPQVTEITQVYSM